jgi:hypothetical protein
VSAATITQALDSYRELRVWRVAMDLVSKPIVWRIYSRRASVSGWRRRYSGRRCRSPRMSPRATAGEYLNHLSVARGSLKELETLLAIAERLGYLAATELAGAEELCDHVSRMLTRLARSLRR